MPARLCLSLLLCLPTASPALAWNGTGHKIIASIAYRQLSEEEQSRIVAILKRHPRFAEDFADQMPEDVRQADSAAQHEWLFQQAAVWPDLVRSGPPAKTAFNRSQWHYINVPHFLSDADRAALQGHLNLNLNFDPPVAATASTETLNIVQVIRLARHNSADEKLDPQSRGLWLAWLFHDVGDLHQPLHATALFSRGLFPSGDRGGNSVKFRQSFNLHSLWDQFPGRQDKLIEARAEAQRLMQDADHATAGRRAAEQVDEAVWLHESHTLAGNSAYAAEVRSALTGMEAAGSVTPIDLSEAYLKSSGQIARRRLVEAGYRLGAVLKQVAGQR
jgi:hypothetical protein